MKKSITSIKSRLLILVLGSVIAIWLVSACFTYVDARHELDEVLDAHLTQAAALLVLQTAHELEEVDTEHTPALHKYSRQVAFQVWEEGKWLRLHSINAPREPLAKTDNGFSSQIINGQPWRVFSTWNNSGEYLIQVAEREDTRKLLARGVVFNLLQPLLIALPLLAILIWLSVSRGMRPLIDLAQDVAQREPDNLVPFETKYAPEEVMPLIERLNVLFKRIVVSMANERRFTADAAHELRTPVAAIKAQLQVARSAEDNLASQRALDNAILGCDRATHLIQQLLTLARLDSIKMTGAEACPLRQLAAEIISEIAPAALDKGISFELVDGEEVVIQGISSLLQIMLRNLIDNAVRYTPPGTQIHVQVSRDANKTKVTVTDNGPGVPEEYLKNLSQRFYRPLGTDTSGSGLGLSIVKRIAEIHDAELRLSNNQEGNGFQAIVTFNVIQ